MLEPRRLAARQIAGRMAYLLGEPVGRTVGYRVRFESRVSRETRLEVLTEGILTRMLVDDPTLEGVAAVIFDEFHERSLQSDVALALTRETQSLLRPDLKIVVMSATMDTTRICSALGAPLVSGEGRMFPVEIVHTGDMPDNADIVPEVARLTLHAHREQDGDILVFLPGEAEIRRCAELFGDALGDAPAGPQSTVPGAGSTRICPLYGMLPFEEQKRAIAPSAPGERKIVLATPIAETSLTIEGVRVVVDSGLCRRMVFDPQNALSRLETVRISMDMATQRSGRAGRVAPGVCYRMWSAASESRMAACRVPEVLEADLAPTVLDIASWGGGDPSSLPWIDMPPKAHLLQATAVLRLLGALDDRGMITPHGRRLQALLCHPRMASMLVSAGSGGSRGTTEQNTGKALAADIAAVLEERDPMGGEDADLCLRVAELRRARAKGGASQAGPGDGVPSAGSPGGVSPASRGGRRWSRIIMVAEQYRRMVRVPEDNSAPDPYEVGLMVGTAYPERIAKAHPDGCGRFILASGDRAAVPENDALAACPWISVAGVNARKDGFGRIFLAAPLDPMAFLPGSSARSRRPGSDSSIAAPAESSGIVRERDNISWDSRKGCVVARHEFNIGCLLVAEKSIHSGKRDGIVAVICAAAAKDGLEMLDFSNDVRNLQRRVACVASWRPELDLPDLSDTCVLDSASEWLPLYIGNATTVQELKKIDMTKVLWGLLSFEQQQAVERFAPSHLTVPTGSRIRVEYRQGAEAPVLRVRLQECFGLVDTPCVDGGRRPVLMELLSPGYKPVQLTSDLRSFWNDTYFEVRKELRRRYPKHSWPDNPLEADAVRGVRRKP